MTTLLSPSELEELRVSTDATYSERKAASEARVVRWEWAKGHYHSFIPLDAECGGWPRGRLYKTVPENVQEKLGFGFDGDGQLCFIREHTGFEGCYNETFVDAEDPRWVWGYQHRNQKQAARVMQRVFEDGRLVAVANQARFGHTIYRFGWRDEHIRTVDEEHGTGSTQHFEVSYLGGLLQEVRLVRDGAEPHVVYTAKPPSLRSLLSAMERRLCEVVRATVAAAAVAEPAFCLVLSYSEESPEEMALPALSVGLESDRQTWRTSGASPGDLWNPAGFATHDQDALELDDGELAELAAEIARGLQAPKNYKAVKKTYLAVAKALAALDWSAILPATEDFKILAVSVDLSDLKQNFKAILGASASKQLAREGLL